jgi:hypothetical protein
VYIQYYYIDSSKFFITAVTLEFPGKITSYTVQYKAKKDKGIRKLKTIMDIARM